MLGLYVSLLCNVRYAPLQTAISVSAKSLKKLLVCDHSATACRFSWC